MIREFYDVAIVGAGPAGMAAASVCARAGLDTVVFDEQGSPGGQIYRGITQTALRDRSILGPDYWSGEKLVQEFRSSGAQYVAGATVGTLTPGLEIGVSHRGQAARTEARSVILCTGAVERPFPIPGASLPGVMSAGAARAQLIASGTAPPGRMILAGTGPLLWLTAWQYLNAGAAIEAILDTTPHANRSRALPHLFGFLRSPHLRKSLELLLALRGRIPVVRGVTGVEAQGEAQLESVSYRTHEGGGGTLNADTLLLHQGIVPDAGLAMSAGVAHRWNDLQLSLCPLLDPNGGTSQPGILIAGDAAGIAGGQVAAWRGVLSALAVVQAMKPGQKLRHGPLARTAVSRWTRGRKFLDALYRPADAFRRPEAELLAQARGMAPAAAGDDRLRPPG
jgi:octopine oxidase subunit A